MFFISACSLLQAPGTVSGKASLQNQRAASAEIALSGLQEIDTLIRLDNDWISDQIKATFTSQAAASDSFAFRRLKLKFGRQFISIDAVLDISDEQGQIIAASISGEILLDFNSSQLEWLPNINQLQITSKDFAFENGDYAEPIPELTRSILSRFNTRVIDALVQQRRNSIPINAVPLGEVQVGASLPGFAARPARHTQSLRGIFMVTGSSMLIESSITTIALDLSFIPDLSTCPADVTVSRGAFASGIELREPVGVAHQISAATDIRYFYSEIAGARQPLTIIHYWFADGLPVSVQELAVGESERWRTWSARDQEHATAKRLEVLVVEKESGCILYSRTIRSVAPEASAAGVDQTQANKTYATFSEKFKERVFGFSISAEKPEIALIEVRRPFLGKVIQAAMEDLSIDAEFDTSSITTLQYSSRLRPFELESVACEQRSCAEAQVCNANLVQCKRLRDTRNCSSCLFRNPLNNRCVSEAIDPICEAARNRQNIKYDVNRRICISNAEASKVECDQLNAQIARSCQIEAGFEGSICESIKSSVQSLQNGAPLALVSAETRSSGTLRASFSNFRIDGDLESLKLDMILRSELELAGDLHFSPANIVRPLAECITAWSGPFKIRFIATPEVNSLLTTFQAGTSELTASWSGFGMTVDTTPSPLQAVFVGNPQLLANCRIGLTVHQVEQAFVDDDADFFHGQIKLDIQPLPTKIHLAPATIQFGDQIYSAKANLYSSYLRFDIKE
ncbi:MAG: hypothetical protein GQ538_10575 [Xanthomonadales bacterium]|nr:hypothetical protein [Xanthomonadales bacterium]